MLLKPDPKYIALVHFLQCQGLTPGPTHANKYSSTALPPPHTHKQTLSRL